MMIMSKWLSLILAVWYSFTLVNLMVINDQYTKLFQTKETQQKSFEELLKIERITQNRQHR